MKPDLSRIVPPGADWQKELKWLGLSFGAATAYSLSFFTRFFSERSRLYRRNGEIKVLLEGAEMPDFAGVLDTALLGFPVLVLLLAALAVWHYAYHRQGSKSIYLMRRLPNGRELHRRCLTLPLLAAAASLLLALILLLLYYWFYMAATPEGCLTPDQWAKLWNTWMGVSL